MSQEKSVFHYYNSENEPCNNPGVGVNSSKAPMTSKNLCPVKTDDERPPSWSTFTENTTCHGIRYIFNSGTRRYRRYCVLNVLV